MDKGIASAVANELVTAVSVMVNGPHVEEGLKLIKAAPPVSFGLHVVLTQGLPLCDPAKIPSLVNSSGLFHSSVFSLVAKRLQPEQISAEIEAQLQRFIALTGGLPAFINTHQHAQILPSVLHVMLALCERHGIRWARLSADRWPMPNFRARSLLWPAISGIGLTQRRRYARVGVRHPQGMLGGPASENLTLGRLKHLLSRVGEGLTELVVHPASGSVDSQALASPLAARIIEARAIQKVGFDAV